jgi:sugar (pentulose or hexulose) kinase
VRVALVDAAGTVLAQIKANVLGRGIETTLEAEHGLVGATAAALVALGHFVDVEAAQSAMVRLALTFRPRPDVAAKAEQRFALFCEACGQLAPLSRRLASAPAA